MVKLDLQLLRTVKDLATVTVAGAVRTYAEQAGAEVVAEGIETAQDLTRATRAERDAGSGVAVGRGERRFTPSTFRPERFAARGTPADIHEAAFGNRMCR